MTFDGPKANDSVWFPVPNATGVPLRDYYIGQALAGLLGSPKYRYNSVTEYADVAAQFADAAMLARKEHSK